MTKAIMQCLRISDKSLAEKIADTQKKINEKEGRDHGLEKKLHVLIQQARSQHRQAA